MFFGCQYFLSIIWDNDQYSSSCKQFLKRVETGELSGYTSIVVLDEIFHRLMLTELYTRFNILPRKAFSTIHDQPELLSRLKTCFEDISFLHQIPHLTILSIDAELQKKAVQFSRTYYLMSHDALQCFL